MSRSLSTITRAADGFECVSTIITPSAFSMIAVLQFTLYAGAATAAYTPSATFWISNFASPPPGPSWPQQSIAVSSSGAAGFEAHTAGQARRPDEPSANRPQLTSTTTGAAPNGMV